MELACPACRGGIEPEQFDDRGEIVCPHCSEPLRWDGQLRRASAPAELACLRCARPLPPEGFDERGRVTCAGCGMALAWDGALRVDDEEPSRTATLLGPGVGPSIPSLALVPAAAPSAGPATVPAPAPNAGVPKKHASDTRGLQPAIARALRRGPDRWMYIACGVAGLGLLVAVGYQLSRSRGNEVVASAARPVTRGSPEPAPAGRDRGQAAITDDRAARAAPAPVAPGGSPPAPAAAAPAPRTGAKPAAVPATAEPAPPRVAQPAAVPATTEPAPPSVAVPATAEPAPPRVAQPAAVPATTEPAPPSVAVPATAEPTSPIAAVPAPSGPRPIARLQFRRASASLRSDADAALDQVLRALAAAPGSVLEIHGHTDDEGVHLRNVELSLARASAARAWLVARGVDPARIRVIGNAPVRPDGPIPSATARAELRRAELFLVAARP